MIRNDVSHVQLVEYFLADMELASFEEVQPLINLINDLSNRTPQWILKGWSPEEVFERYEKPALKPLPAVPFDFKGAQSDKKTSPKVGRNEPCPCGSGKKYKKCCSAVVNEEIQEEQIALAFEDLLMDGGNPDLNGRETAVVGKEKPAMDEQEKLDPKKQETAPEEKEPTLEEWGMLYEAATAFKEARCWEWMDDDDLFGVMDPETGLIAYCCIMGRLGEHYALGAYLGPQGLESIYDLMEGSGDFSPDLMLSQKCLMASFEDREYINKRDRAVINELGLKFRGRGQWPLFRSYEPGLYPWFITSRECRFLTLVLEQALAVSLRCQNGKALLDGDQPTAYLVRVPGGQGQELTWEDRYLEAEPYTEECISFPIYDELALKKLAASGKKNGAIWEVDIFTVPNPVQEKKNERPFYPKGFLILESPHGLLLGFVLMKDYSKEGHKCIERFIGLVERLGVPARIDVEKEETYCLLSDTCRLLNISLNVVDRLECLPGAREVMFGRLRQR
ncbi:Tryptophan synthase beta chain (modular protein) [anaerobic digester metagenome]|uniref:Tryptophan synthase beta chain (Modular protein) n=1 Tax=anaerobic digester metagenome TaxID=1263854 RepID=A0A485M7Z0_9ZZZZ